MTLDNPAAVIDVLDEVEADLAVRQNDYEKAAEDVARLKRDWDHKLAVTFLTTEGTVKERESKTLVAVVAGNVEFYDDFKDAEGRLAALKAVIGVLETRASIAQSVLKAQVRDSFLIPQGRAA